MAYYSTDTKSALLLAYVRRYGVRESDVLKECRLKTIKEISDSGMMTTPEEAEFLSFFIKSLGFKNGLEIGVFSGYSSTSLALSMPKDGHLTCCEKSKEWAEFAQTFWEKAGVEDKITCFIGDAVETLKNMLADGKSSSFDFAYIDANKESYDTYYEYSLELVRTGGMIILDNMLWGGKVVDKNDKSPETIAIQDLNKKISQDTRVEFVLTTIGDGVTFARKL